MRLGLARGLDAYMYQMTEDTEGNDARVNKNREGGKKRTLNVLPAGRENWDGHTQATTGPCNFDITVTRLLHGGPPAPVSKKGAHCPESNYFRRKNGARAGLFWEPLLVILPHG